MLRPLHLQPVLLCLAYLAGRSAVCQTLIINEVSNGPAGSMEYIEMLVVPDGPVTPCAPPACLDLRGWIIDDNNGYHGAGGVAQGAARFAAHPLWSCVPVGTLIVIHNAADVNPAVPATDATLADGNCRLIIPSSDLTYFEYTNTTPDAALCGYPGGWGSTTLTWQSCLAFANTGDCAYIADAAGCTVFSLCYGSVSQNASVYFPGNGTDRVWSFSSGDPFDPGDWVTGCAGDLTACGSDDQTPGAANDAANAAWMAGFNNGCVPQQLQDPLVATASATPACGCDGTATALASGSVTPYTFAWYAEDWTAVGQIGAEASGLCGGTYHVIVTSANGCADTATVSVQEVVPADAGGDATIGLCSSGGSADLFAALTGTPQSGGTWSPTLSNAPLFDPAVDIPGAYTYTVIGNGGCPPDHAVVQVDVGVAPTLTMSTTDVSCAGFNDGTLAVGVVPSGTYTYAWSGGLPATPAHTGVPAGIWTVEVSSAPGCSATATATIHGPDALASTITSDPAFCGEADGGACISTEGGTAPYSVLWNDPAEQTGDCATALAAGSYTAMVTDANGCGAPVVVVVAQVGGAFTVTPDVTDVYCSGAATGSIALTISPPGEYVVEWSGPDDYTAAEALITNLTAGTYNYTVEDATGCTATDLAQVDEPGPLTLGTTTTPTSCAGNCDGSITPQLGGGTPPWQLALNDEPVAMGTIAALCAGTYTLSMTDAAGCALSTTVVIAEGIAPVVPMIAPVGPFCSDATTAQLSATPIGGIWNGPGMVDTNAGLFAPGSAHGGQHSITYTLLGPCGSSASTVIVVNTAPTARFSTPLEAGAPVVDNSLHADAVHWWLDGADMGDGPQLALPEGEGDRSFLVCLAAYTTAGCGDTVCAVISTPTPLQVHVPNAFSPNNDDINDQFHVALSGPPLQRYMLTIYDRWGRPLYSTTDPLVGWNGEDVPIGVYAWQLSLATEREERVLNGHVVLVR